MGHASSDEAGDVLIQMISREMVLTTGKCSECSREGWWLCLGHPYEGVQPTRTTPTLPTAGIVVFFASLAPRLASPVIAIGW